MEWSGQLFMLNILIGELKRRCCLIQENYELNMSRFFHLRSHKKNYNHALKCQDTPMSMFSIVLEDFLKTEIKTFIKLQWQLIMHFLMSTSILFDMCDVKFSKNDARNTSFVRLWKSGTTAQCNAYCIWEELSAQQFREHILVLKS